MSEIEKKLLQQAYQHYTNTGDFNFSFVIPSSKMLTPLITATISLHENGYIENISDNVYADALYISNDMDDIYQDFRIKFSLTSKGIREAQ